MVLYNYFREKWLVDRLANTSARSSAAIRWATCTRSGLPRVMLAGPRLAELTAPPPLPPDVTAYGSRTRRARPIPSSATPGVVLATDNGRSSTCARRICRALSGRAGAGAGRVGACGLVRAEGRWGSDHLSRSDPGSLVVALLLPRRRFMLLETKSIVQFALLWGSTWSSASLAIASVLVMALASALVASRVEIRRPARSRPRCSR